MVVVVVVVVDMLFRILLPLRKIWVVIVDTSLFLVILEDVIFVLHIFMTPILQFNQYLGTIVIVLRNGGRIEGWVKSSIVVVGGVQTPVFGLSPVGAGDKLGDRSERVQRLVDSVVALVAQHHLKLI